MNSEKTIIPSLRNIEWRTIKTETNKINQVLPYTSKNNITELNEQIYAGVKLVSEKIGIPSKSTKKKIKTRMGNSTGNADKKNSTRTGQIDKPKERRWNTLKQKGKGIKRKNISTTWGNKPESAGVEGRLKRYRQRVINNYSQDK